MYLWGELSQEVRNGAIPAIASIPVANKGSERDPSSSHSSTAKDKLTEYLVPKTFRTRSKLSPMSENAGPANSLSSNFPISARWESASANLLASMKNPKGVTKPTFSNCISERIERGWSEMASASTSRKQTGNEQYGKINAS